MIDPDTAVVLYAPQTWSSIFRRPQQIASRLARTRRVLFVEPPGVPNEARGGADEHEPSPGVRVVRPGLESSGAETGALCALVRELLAREGIERHVAWLYGPRALDAASVLAPSLLVYDCITDLSSAGAELRSAERELIRAADVVFTAGPSLYRVKHREHPHVLCLPSSVDVAHFARAQELPDHWDQAHLPRPRLGFFGVLDERLDLALLDRVARTHSDWQIVLVGPTARIDLASLPSCPNLHYAGARGYAELPHFLAGWDACLLPFARNASTRCCSPAQLLEYMAASRPFVSTSLPDVVEHYGDVAYLADGAGFVEACERALAADPAERAMRAVRMRRVLMRTSWDATVNAMQLELGRALQRRAWRNSVRPLARRMAPPRPALERQVS